MNSSAIACFSKVQPGASILSICSLGAVGWLASLQVPGEAPGVAPGEERGVLSTASAALDGVARGHSMAAYAKGFLGRLDEGERALATTTLDNPERITWAFGPVRREGIRVGQLGQEQFGLLEALLDTALSETGMQAWHEIRDLENVLRRLESTPERVAEHRDPNLYWLRVYGTPDPKERWSWRFEGHHIALHVSCRPGEVPAVTPFFLGANPLFSTSADASPADRLPRVQAFADLNAALLGLLAEFDEPTAMAAMPALSGAGPQDRPGDIRMGPGHRDLPPASGATREQLSPAARAGLDRILATYLDLLEPDLRMFSLEATSPGDVHFSRWGGTGLGEARTWSILTGTFALELATTDGPHHVHALFRDVTRDFGGE